MSISLFALSGVLTPGFVRLLYYQGMRPQEKICL
jgi:hypothetical protein